MTRLYSDSRRASSSPSSRSGRSCRNTAAQLGSSTTTGVPVRSAGRSTSSVRRSTRLAVRSWPVEIQVSPQHAVRRGMSTAKPASCNTVTASRAMSGSKLLVNVSGHNNTRPRGKALGGWDCRCHHRVNRSSANRGSSRCWSTPPTALIAVESPRACASALTAPGAVAANRAHRGIQPIE